MDTVVAPILLVIADDSKEMPVALRYAARRARLLRGRVGLLAVVEPQEIETWSGVERAMTDEAFDLARKKIAAFEAVAEEFSGQPPVVFFRKGECRAALWDLIESERGIVALVLAARTQEAGANPLIQYLTSDKGLKKLKIPLVVVPDDCRAADCA